MSQYLFGSGAAWGTPLADAAGNVIATPTPQQFMVLQEISLDISFENKMLHGQNQFPVAVGRGKGKISGKSKWAQVNGGVFNALFFGQTMTNGIIGDVYETTGALIPTTPFTITPTVPESGTWSADLGVRDANGLPMVRVASAPAAGQYSVSAGVYTFAAADTGKRVFINYQYTATSTSATKLNVVNQPMGYAPSFKLDLFMPYQGKKLIVTLPKVISTKLAFAAKNDDFTVPDMDFEAFADDSGNVITMAMSE